MAITKTDDESTETAIREAKTTGEAFSRVVEQLAKTIGGHSHADTIFGAPITRDGVTVIPVARVIGGFGAGSAGAAPSADVKDGFGGGGGFMVTPVGMIEIRPEGARFRKLEQPLGAWGDVGELVLFLLRRGWNMLRRQ